MNVAVERLPNKHRHNGALAPIEGGPGGQVAAFLGTTIGRPDPSRRRLKRLRPLHLTLGSCWPNAEVGDDKPTIEQLEGVAREDRDDLRRRQPKGRLQGARGGFLPAGSPITQWT